MKLVLRVNAVFLGIVGVLALGASFQDVPPIIGAYTLRGGEWQIGGSLWFSLASPGLLTSLNLDYGLTPFLQAGLEIASGWAPDTDFPYMAYKGEAKWRLSLWPGLDLAFLVAGVFDERGIGLEFGSLGLSVLASGRLGANLTLHSGVSLGLARTGTFFAPPYLMVDFDLAPNLKFVGELSVIPLNVVLSTWIRAFPFLDLQVRIAPLALWLQGAVYLRF